MFAPQTEYLSNKPPGMPANGLFLSISEPLQSKFCTLHPCITDAYQAVIP